MTAPLDASPEITAMVELERLAKAATPGPWQVGGQWFHVTDVTAQGTTFVTMCRTKEGGGHNDAAFIAAANPETILKLLALLRRLGEREARMREVMAKGWSAFACHRTSEADIAMEELRAALAAGKEGE